MTATFQFQIRRVYTADENSLTDVIKKVDYEITGTQDGQSFSLPQTKTLGPADPATFVAYGSLTQELMESWVNDDTAPKAHIQWVLDEMCAKAALTAKTPPWVPAPEELPAAPTT